VKRITTFALALTLGLGMSGCAAGPNSYANVEALKSAYISAGGVCGKSTVVDTTAFTADNADLLGISGISCPDDIGIFTFPSNQARDYFVDLVDTAATASKTGVHMVVGEKWLVAGIRLDNKKFAGPLGGTARY
jgi:hypothetical protein